MSIIYKYLPPDRASYLDDELLRFTQPSALNDPYECIPIIQSVDTSKFLQGVVERNPQLLANRFGDGKKGLRAAKKAIRVAKGELRNKYRNNPNFLQQLFLTRYLFHANDSLGIFSLSRRWDSTLMWAHYCSSHSGFCVGFDSTHSFFKRQPQDPGDAGLLVPVEYEANRLSIPIDKQFQIPTPLFYRKSPDWKYEEEERLVRLLKHSNAKVNRPPLDVFLFKVPHTAIVEITYGISASPALKRKIIDKAKLLGVPAWEALISTTSFDVERKPIP